LADSCLRAGPPLIPLVCRGRLLAGTTVQPGSLIEQRDGRQKRENLAVEEYKLCSFTMPIPPRVNVPLSSEPTISFSASSPPYFVPFALSLLVPLLSPVPLDLVRPSVAVVLRSRCRLDDWSVSSPSHSLKLRLEFRLTPLFSFSFSFSVTSLHNGRLL
jgi:hypothetical protein